jgi:hypothetical protein
MEEMVLSPMTGTAVDSDRGPDAVAPRDLREWLQRVEAIGELKRIKIEVDRDEEMSAVAYMAGQTVGSPALLF